MDGRGKTISVITPSLNQAGYIGEAIKSVLSQGGDFFLDYIIMDGGSTDGSVGVIKKYAEMVESGALRPECLGVKLRWFSSKDGGQTQAINKGIGMAEGQFITWINSDDYFLPGAFKKVMDAFSRHPEADFINGDGLIVDEAGRTKWEHLTRRFSLKEQLSYLYPLGRFGYCILQQGTFWRRDVHGRIGMLDESFEFAMDAEFFVRARAAGLNFVHIPEALAAFRLIAGTKSTSSETVFWPDMLEIFRRNHGAGALQPFLTQYLFEEGLYNGCRIEHIEEKKEAILKRWRTLPPEEVRILAEASERALPMALLKLGNKTFTDGQPALARELAEEAVKRKPSLAAHPSMLAYRLKKACGPRAARSWEHVKQFFLHYYGFRYDYRYLFRKIRRLAGRAVS